MGPRGDLSDPIERELMTIQVLCRGRPVSPVNRFVRLEIRGRQSRVARARLCNPCHEPQSPRRGITNDSNGGE